MEQHGENPRQLVIAIIPARLASTRLEGKLLLPLVGKPLILHTVEQAKKAKRVDRVIVATDNEEIFQVVTENGNDCVMTSSAHENGTERIAEVAAGLAVGSIIVNVQGDEPLIPPGMIDSAVDAMLADSSAKMTTTCEVIQRSQDVLSSDVVKLVVDHFGNALYFSRSPIPYPRNEVKRCGSLEMALEIEPGLVNTFRKHTGLYVYRREFLLDYTKLPPANLEKGEMLEQLRVLESGFKIRVVEVKESSIGVDTRADFERVREILEK